MIIFIMNIMKHRVSHPFLSCPFNFPHPSFSHPIRFFHPLYSIQIFPFGTQVIHLWHTQLNSLRGKKKSGGSIWLHFSQMEISSCEFSKSKRRRRDVERKGDPKWERGAPILLASLLLKLNRIAFISIKITDLKFIYKKKSVRDEHLIWCWCNHQHHL